MGDINEGDTALMFVAMCLVQFMTPGLAFFYGGLVRSTNIISIVIQCFIALGIVFLLWYICAFSLGFGRSIYGVIGDPLTFFCFTNLSVHAPLEVEGGVNVPGIPGVLFAAYQGMFAVITPALMTGAFADRVRLGPYMVLLALWTILIYGPVCHWVWGGGWMQQWGVWDFAGGLVVHTTSGFSALACLKILGKRNIPEEEQDEITRPHNVPFVALGTAMLWFGWFGFNGGSALASNGVAIAAAVNSQIAGSTAMLGWLVMDNCRGGKKVGLVAACVGAVAGLATVTPAAGYIQSWGAFVIGIVASVVCYGCVEFAGHVQVDDALDVWGVHGMGGFVGTILVGVLADGPECAQAATDADPKINCVNPGTVTRSVQQLWIQTACAVIVAVYSYVVTLGLVFLMNAITPIRPKERHEHGLDDALHGEVAYHSHQTKNLAAEESTNASTYSSDEEPSLGREGTYQYHQAKTLEDGRATPLVTPRE